MRALRHCSRVFLIAGLWIVFLCLAGCGSEPFREAPEAVGWIPLPDMGPAAPYGIVIQRTVPLENPRDPDWKPRRFCRARREFLAQEHPPRGPGASVRAPSTGREAGVPARDILRTRIRLILPMISGA